MTLVRATGPQLKETVYICYVNGARKSNAQVAIRTQTPCSNFFLEMAGEDSAPKSNFSKYLKLSEASRAKKLIGLQVNINKANSRRYDVTRYGI